MIQDLVVEIFVPECGTNGKKGQIATGYPIARDRILTARHPLFPAPGRDPDRPIEIRWRCRDIDPCWRPVGDIVWEDQGWNLALLACTLPTSIDRWGAFLSEERPVPNAQWYSVGFPRVGGKRNGARKPFGMGGSIKAAIDSADRFEVDETAGPENAEAWKGASGSPVFVDSRIFGVIVSVPKNVKARRLSVVPIWRLLREVPDFCKQIGYQQRKDRRDALEQAVCAALSPARVVDAVSALAAEIPGLAVELEGRTNPERAAVVARRLLNLEMPTAPIASSPQVIRRRPRRLRGRCAPSCPRSMITAWWRPCAMPAATPRPGCSRSPRITTPWLRSSWPAPIGAPWIYASATKTMTFRRVGCACPSHRSAATTRKGGKPPRRLRNTWSASSLWTRIRRTDWSAPWTAF
ncbi:hypothetical protein [uncultured Lamprocystis sp.]|uniref:hypothetical protein n=1 Tax=uncultured Lamprocystis sp. TaxID=543132 RepID=UPI0025E3D3DA|nr:hypothetical protein [uncultured Lamprocystis sp.]